MRTLALCEQNRDICAGCNGIQHKPRLHAEALASLGATGGKHSAAALRGHTSTEAVNLSTLTGVRLVRAFHLQILSYDLEQPRKYISYHSNVKKHMNFITGSALRGMNAQLVL